MSAEGSVLGARTITRKACIEGASQGMPLTIGIEETEEGVERQASIRNCWFNIGVLARAEFRFGCCKSLRCRGSRRSGMPAVLAFACSSTVLHGFSFLKCCCKSLDAFPVHYKKWVA